MTSTWWKYGLIATGLALALVHPASAATIFDSHVYAAGNAYISGGSNGDIVAGSFTNANGSGGRNFSSLSSATPALTAEAQRLSAAYGALTATGSYSSLYGRATLTGTQSGINIFNLDANQYGGNYALDLTGLGTGAIINVTGLSFSNFIRVNYGSLSADQVVFNFVNATAVTMGGWDVAGSILAPLARVQLQGGSVAGSVISGSFHAEGTRIGGQGFIGIADDTTPSVPESATWAMMILGFGMIGAALRRRSARMLRLA